uniref:Acidic thaumatin-like protein 13 n=1 Tax=Taxus x media TaxID=85957 RepID=A2TEI1_9CONI|nr:acidic thaumatin-like protein 13 precursor [Taxus x media]
MATISVSGLGHLVLLLGIAVSVYVQEAGAAKFEITNQCSYTVWAAGTPGGGQQLQTGETWSVDVAAGTAAGRFWGRTGCSFDGNGRGSCQTGDCGGLLSCQASGAVPASLAEYSLNQDQNKDCYDISLVDGFNVPISLAPTNGQCTTTSCKSDINAVCPAELKVSGGCNSACAAFHTDQYCCTGANTDNCAPTNYSMFFKNQCPQAYSYAKDDASSTFTCSSGTTDYKIVFCP